MNLPNLHPAVVHFPIALWLAAVLFDVACLMIRRHRWIDLTAASLYAMGALGAGAAYLAGEWAEDSLIDLPASLETLVEDHSDWAWWTLIVFAVVAVLRLAILRIDRGVGHRLTGVRWLALLAALGGTWALVETADRGGALVYRHGVAVTPADAGADAARAPASTALPAPSAASALSVQTPAPSAAPASPVIRGADGTLVWMPGPDDSAQLSAILTNAVGSDPAAVTAESVSPSAGAPAGPGINLRVSGRSMLLLSGSYGDVQLEAVLDLTGFQGAAGLAHHAGAFDDAGIYQITTQGIASLVHLRSGRDRQLDQAETTLPLQPMKLVLSSAGMHIKGMLNGKVLVHAHEAPAPDGSVGLLLDGHGIVRLISLQVEPLRHAGRAR